MQKFSILFILISIFNSSAIATEKTTSTINVEVYTGNLTLHDLINASGLIAKATPSKSVDRSIPGEIITLKDKKYEVRYFSFEDTASKLPAGQTFKEYAEEKKIMELGSVSTTPLPGIIFESFDFRRAKLDDGVYFSMALRLIEDKK